MKNMKKQNTYEEIAKEISKNLENSNFLFSYKENYEKKELYKNILKRPFNLARIFTFIFHFVILTIILFLIYDLLKFSFSFLYIISISFAGSILLTILVIRKSVQKLIEFNGTIIYFYNTFLICKRKNRFEKYFYNDISSFSENTYKYSFSLRNKSVGVYKNSISSDFSQFLSNIKTNYKNIKKDSDEESVWTDLTSLMEENKRKQNLLNQVTLNKYCSSKPIYKIMLFRTLIIFFVSTFLIVYILNKINETPFDLIFFFFLFFAACCGTIISIPLSIDNIIETVLKKWSQESLYLFQDFLLVKNNNSIVKYEYQNLKFIFENEYLIGIKANNYNYPFIFNKQELSIQEYNMLLQTKNMQKKMYH